MKRSTKNRKNLGSSGGARRRPSARARSSARVDDRLRLPRAAKGKRAQFYADPAIDQLMAITAALTAELSVAFERIHTLERILAKRGHLERREIDAYEPGDAESAERATAREELIERVFQVLEVTGRTR